jgi:hypothetical protein
MRAGKGGQARNARRPVLVVNEGRVARRVTGRPSVLGTRSPFARAIRRLHQIDAELVRDVADDQE